MDLSFAVAWARHACWHHALIADADGVLQRSGDRLTTAVPTRASRSIAQWHAHRDLHRQMLAEVEQELTNAELVVAHHRATTVGTPEDHAVLRREMARRGLISSGGARQ